MVEQADIDPLSDGRSDVARLLGLVDGPVAALGLSSGAAVALEQALEVRTVWDLADNKYVRRAQGHREAGGREAGAVSGRRRPGPSLGCEWVGQGP